MQVTLEMSQASGNTRKISLKRDALIGRSSDCNLRIGSDKVSRKHCQLLLEESRVVVRDLASMNGTFLNGQRLQPNESVPLADGAEISIGPARFVVRVEHEPTTVSSAALEPVAGESATEFPVHVAPTAALVETVSHVQEAAQDETLNIPDDSVIPEHLIAPVESVSDPAPESDAGKEEEDTVEFRDFAEAMSNSDAEAVAVPIIDDSAFEPPSEAEVSFESPSEAEVSFESPIEAEASFESPIEAEASFEFNEMESETAEPSSGNDDEDALGDFLNQFE